MTRTIATLVAAALLVVAGCAGGLSPAPVDEGATDTGTVSFWVSDQRNAIDQFEHLEVTITTVGFVPAGADDSDDATATPDGNATATPDGNATATPDDNATATPDGNATDEADDGDGERVTFDVDERTVDLTQLQGDNATKLADLDLPAGTYASVFVRVSEVNGTLTTGEQVDVKLPSETLRLSVPLTVGANGTVDYVFDVTVHETGNGMYILRPVVGESGPDVPISDVGRAADAGRPDDPGNASDGAGDAPEDADNASDDRGNASAGGPPTDAGAPDDGNETDVERPALDVALVGDATR